MEILFGNTSVRLETYNLQNNYLRYVFWERPKQCFCFVFVLFFVLFLLVLVVLVVVLVVLAVVSS